MKDVSGAALEYQDGMDLTLDIYKDTWPLAEHMNWFIPASVRDASGISIGDGSSISKQFAIPQEDKSSAVSQDDNELLNTSFCDDDSLASTQHSINSRSNTPRPKSRNRGDDLEMTIANVASSLTTLIQKQNERTEKQTVLPEQIKLKYAQMYEELDKALANASFLDAVKFLTTTIEKANLQFNSIAD